MFDLYQTFRDSDDGVSDAVKMLEGLGYTVIAPDPKFTQDVDPEQYHGHFACWLPFVKDLISLRDRMELLDVVRGLTGWDQMFAWRAMCDPAGCLLPLWDDSFVSYQTNHRNAEWVRDRLLGCDVFCGEFKDLSSKVEIRSIDGMALSGMRFVLGLPSGVPLFRVDDVSVYGWLKGYCGDDALMCVRADNWSHEPKVIHIPRNEWDMLKWRVTPETYHLLGWVKSGG
jgi:hypothetical protein